MALFELSDFEISAPQCPTHSPARNGDVLDIVVHQNIRVSGVIVSDILDSLRSPTNNIPQTGSCPNWETFGTC
jgi:hypothetical protein